MFEGIKIVTTLVTTLKKAKLRIWLIYVNQNY